MAFSKIKKSSKIPKILTGRHLGESAARDVRISNCGSNECGINDLDKTIEPLSIWRNCDIWDFILTSLDNCLYEGCADSLLKVYDITESSNNLRMGCFMCPVISVETIAANPLSQNTPEVLQIRLLLELLRNARRIRNQKTRKAGAILVDDRISFWAELSKYFDFLLDSNWITTEEICLIDSMLAARTYPESYNQEWIAQEEPQATKWVRPKRTKKAKNYAINNTATT